MPQVVQLVLVMAALVGILVFMIRGPRAGRGNWHDRWSALGQPNGNLGVAVLGVLAIAQLAALPGNGAGVTVTLGIGVGAVLGLLIQASVTRRVLDIIGAVAAVATGIEFLGSDSYAGSVVDAVPFRIALLALLTACFVLGAGVGLRFMGRSVRTFAFGKGRGLAFFALIEAFVFLAHPAGADLLALSGNRAYAIFVIGAVAAFVMGALASQFLLFVVGAALAVLAVLLPVAGLATSGGNLPGYAVGALAAYLIVSRVTAWVRP